MSAKPNLGSIVALPGGRRIEKVMTLKMGPEFFNELEQLTQSKSTYDLIVVDAVACGFLFNVEILVEAVRKSRKLLAVQGGFVFAKSDSALAVIRENLTGDLSIHVFDGLNELYDFSPTLAGQVQGILGRSIVTEGTDLAEQVLMSSIPVLTESGIRLKAGLDSSKNRHLVLCAIDNYTPVSTIIQRLANKIQISREDLLQELKDLEKVRAIFPVFPKIPFLVQCFNHQVAFKLNDYLLASKLITQRQLDDLLLERQRLRVKERMSIGAMCIAHGYLTTRQFEIMMQDLAFYGQSGETEKVKLVSSDGEHTLVQSLVGYLGTTDPSGLLQSLTNNRESGVISVEHRDLQFRAVLESGRLTHAKLGRLKSHNAVMEFASTWSEGIFVFIQRQPPDDLIHESCQLTKPLEKVLLDAALARDNLEVIWKKLPRREKTPLEKLPDTKNLLASGDIEDPQDKHKLSERELKVMQDLHLAFDGLTPLINTIKNLGDVTTAEGAAAIDRLLHLRLVSIPGVDEFGPLDNFRRIAGAIAEQMGNERNLALLRLSLQATQGYSVRARMFVIGALGEIGLDLGAARESGTSLSMILKDLESWQAKYIEYVRAELDADTFQKVVS